jgi:glutamate racemase
VNTPAAPTGQTDQAGLIGVFDSGVGGLSVLEALLTQLPSARFIYIADTAYAPYGERSLAQIQERAFAISRYLLKRGASLIVIACNTATAAAIADLRQAFPHTPFVGVEPALKQAARLSSQGRVGVLATRATLSSTKWAQLRQQVEQAHSQLMVTCVPCDGLAQAIETQNAQRVDQLCQQYIRPFKQADVDSVVLGCTHYVWAQSVLETYWPARYMNVAQPVAQQVQRLWCSCARASSNALHFESNLTRETTGSTIKSMSAPAKKNLEWQVTGGADQVLAWLKRLDLPVESFVTTFGEDIYD